MNFDPDECIVFYKSPFSQITLLCREEIRESFSIHFLVMPMALIIFCISVVVLIALILMVVLGLICLLADQNDGVDEDCENIVHL